MVTKLIDIRVLFILSIVLISYCCSTKIQRSNMNYELCSKTNAVKKAEEYLKQNKLYEKDYVSEVRDSLDNFIVTISPASINRLGGGGKFIISKDKCEIVEAELFQ